MISLSTLFLLTIFFFAGIGAMRGWTREVISMAGLILSIFTIYYGAAAILTYFPLTTLSTPVGGEIDSATRQSFYTLATIHLFIAFFSYQGPTFAGARIRDRLRIRDNFQDKLLGFIVGAINGYLFNGTLWALLENYPQSLAQWAKLDPGINYPFREAIILRPDIATSAANMVNNLPIPLLSDWLIVLVVVVFLFVIVVLI